MCRLEGVVDPNMGTMYLMLQNKTKELEKDFVNTHFRYKLVEVPPDAV